MLKPFFAWLKRDLRAAVSLAFLLALGLLALCAPLIAPYPVTAQDVREAAPSSASPSPPTPGMSRSMMNLGMIKTSL